VLLLDTPALTGGAILGDVSLSGPKSCLFVADGGILDDGSLSRPKFCWFATGVYDVLARSTPADFGMSIDSI
jgi:hypothetical protein